jgi:hypothetical protein
MLPRPTPEKRDFRKLATVGSRLAEGAWSERKDL